MSLFRTVFMTHMHTRILMSPGSHQPDLAAERNVLKPKGPLGLYTWRFYRLSKGPFLLNLIQKGYNIKMGIVIELEELWSSGRTSVS